MNKYDEFVQKELAAKLTPGEGIEVTGFLYTKSLAFAAVTHGLSLGGDGFFFAAVTRKRMFLIATEMGAASLKMMNKSVGEFPYADIQSIKPSGFLNQKMITITLNDGKELVFRLNTLATGYASGQKKFIDSLTEFHRAVKG